MKPIEPATAARPAARVETRLAQLSPGPNGTPAPAPAPSGHTDIPAVAVSRHAGETAPVQQERVAEIRKAIENGTYPILPTTIADAMIAAGFLLRQGK